MRGKIHYTHSGCFKNITALQLMFRFNTFPIIILTKSLSFGSRGKDQIWGSNYIWREISAMFLRPSKSLLECDMRFCTSLRKRPFASYLLSSALPSSYFLPKEVTCLTTFYAVIMPAFVIEAKCSIPLTG